MEAKSSFAARLLGREIDDSAVRSKSWRKIYTDRRLIDDLDIVNELDGHSGCVNALSWSRSGHLLASGSDDLHLNIHTYQPESTGRQFQLAATVATGHTQNIFSVKFMPHSNDRTVITAAGDSQVRIFDLEYAGQTRAASAASESASDGRRRVRNRIYDGVRYLSDGDTNARVYRSHRDRVKRIVTESSPYLFLTCSEDGEVRQWDLRQPSSAYPEPRGLRLGNDSSVPPPLISYKRYSLDLNTISCSASQPHYIALGGAHLHAFLHDRRMAGRDKLTEMGRPLSPIDKLSPEEQELLGQATQCVRKFAPDGRKKMKRGDNGHITACKISDARPDEMVVSWSGDHIYSFDLVRDLDKDTEESEASQTNRAKESRDRKRKRKPEGSETSLAQDTRASSKPRTGASSESSQAAALRIHYQNGQSEDIPLSSQTSEREASVRAVVKATTRIQFSMFARSQSADSTSRANSALSEAAAILDDVDEILRSWGYPIDPSPHQVSVQAALRSHRERTRRFVQAAGTLARVLGGTLRTPSGTSPLMAHFTTIELRNSDLPLSQRERFSYDFLRAILIWLDSGIGQMIESFTKSADTPPKLAERSPIPESEASPEAVDEFLVPYLLGLSGDEKILDPDRHPLETDQSRQLFANEKEAVRAFAAAVKIPFQDLTSLDSSSEVAEHPQVQDRKAAREYWARRVGRGLLQNAQHGLSSITIHCGFGGSGRPFSAGPTLEELIDWDLETEEEHLRAAEVINGDGDVIDGATAEDITDVAQERRQRDREMDQEMDEADQTSHHLMETETDDEVDEDTADRDDFGDVDPGEEGSERDDEESEMSSEPDEEDGVPNIGVSRFVYRSADQRRRLRAKVEQDVACSGPTRTYRGHCNVRTVKDVNYFGPDDQYVVSGSDDGNLFIWDRKTTELVNVLEGDSEVVNVVQGHPYETMIAASGIDHTIKIYSPDARTREAARLGQGISAHDVSSFSTMAWPRRVGRRRPRQNTAEQPNSGGATTTEAALSPAEDDDDEDYVAPTGLRSRRRMQDSYQIMQNNDMERQGGNQETVITLPHAQLLQLLFGQLGNTGILDFE